jgi:hypothetical protein
VSSAILYVAIVAIWACVLIPRWLRRDSARGAGNEADTQVAGEVVQGDIVPDEDTADDDAPRVDEMASTVQARYADYDDYGGHADYTGTYNRTYTGTARAEEVPAAAARAGDVPEPGAETRHAAPPVREDARRRMLAARRRLLGMLVILEIAAIALAMVKLAALWVLIPPTIMLIGYLLLLREASHADAERAQREEDAARAQARAQARARERAARRGAAAPPAAAPPPPARRYEDPGPGRDFAPGLAGKYTTSNAEVIAVNEQADEEFRDEYTANKLRAVGD